MGAERVRVIRNCKSKGKARPEPEPIRAKPADGHPQRAGGGD